jgi:hypothetical protein
MRLPQEPLNALTAEYFLNINENNNIYCNCSCEMGRSNPDTPAFVGLNRIAKCKNCNGSSDPFPSRTQSTKVCSREKPHGPKYRK